MTRILVVGDLIIDVYTKGIVERISPEAPVPVIHVSEVTESRGGAGNVALNLEALGVEPILLCREDSETYRVPRKNRFLSQGQQLIRADYEEIVPLSLQEMAEVLIRVQEETFDAIAISDYGKGFLTRELLQNLIAEGKRRGVPVLVDPKGADFTRYHGATLIKPNEKEAYTAAGLDKTVSRDVVAQTILSSVEVEYLVITCSEKGMALYTPKGESQLFPVEKKEVIDVTGAGDTAFAVIAMGLSEGMSLEDSIVLANRASSLAVERVGCAVISRSEVMR